MLSASHLFHVVRSNLFSLGIDIVNVIVYIMVITRSTICVTHNNHLNKHVMQVRTLINRLEELASKHGDDTEVEIFSQVGREYDDGDDVRNHAITNVGNGWYNKEKGDLINIECYRD